LQKHYRSAGAAVVGKPNEILKTIFGYDSFRDQQQAIINQLLLGKDALVLMPTGGGKSLCYQIPALIRDGVGIVISPLIALMQDQVNALLQLGVKAAYLNSTLSPEEATQVEQDLMHNKLELLYIAPERLTTPRTAALFEKIRIALFAIDEAHCVSQWGHDFRADYLQLSRLHECYPNVPRIALTATADSKTREEIIQRLGLEQAAIFLSSFDRPNICYRIVLKQSAKQQLLDFIQTEHDGDSGIVYCLSRKKVDETAEWLRSNGVNALPYHAGMSNDLRQRNQHRFLLEEGLVIVATIAFGMGIDKPNVKFVAHLDLPKSIEGYYQETGRAGRDGLPADAWMAYGLQDVITLRRMLAESNSDEARKRVEFHKLDAMLALCEQVYCRRQTLLGYFDETLDKPCGNCDTCLTPIATWDATLAAQQALSCIYRTQQRFGVAYLIEVLLGKSSERVTKFAHERLSTFGIGQALDEKQWYSVFRQMVARGLVCVDFDNFGALKLTEACRPILRGEQQLMLRKDVLPEKVKHSSRFEKQTRHKQSGQLWDALRNKRRAIAEAQDVPAFVIFHDATLMAMQEKRPRTLSEMSLLSGVGKRKLELYGEDFLAVIADFRDIPVKKKDNTASESLMLFKQGHTIQQIATERELKETTIYGHLAQSIEQGLIELYEVVNLSLQELNQIEQALINLPEQDKTALRPVFEIFNGQYSYEVLRCVRAALQFQTA
jgi:ATP-dependent DNA helicase RecQ